MIVSLIGAPQTGKTLYTIEVARRMRANGQSVTFIAADRRGPKLSQVPTGASAIFCYLDEIVTACAVEVSEGTDLIVVDEVPAHLSRSVMSVLAHSPASAIAVSRPLPGAFPAVMSADSLLLAMPDENPYRVDEADRADAFVSAMLA